MTEKQKNKLWDKWVTKLYQLERALNKDFPERDGHELSRLYDSIKKMIDRK